MILKAQAAAAVQGVAKEIDFFCRARGESFKVQDIFPCQKVSVKHHAMLSGASCLSRRETCRSGQEYPVE